MICSKLKGDPIRLLYSPHAFIDAFHQLVNEEEFVADDEYRELYNQVLYQWEFLFFECRDKYRLPDQWSFEDLYISRQDLFRYTDEDITWAIDFAMGLGIPGIGDNFFDETASFATGYVSRTHKYPLSKIKKFQYVAEIYYLSAQFVSVNSNTFQEEIRNSLRKAIYISTKGKLDMIPQKDELFKLMSENYTEDQLRQPLNVTKENRCYPRINCISDLIHCICDVFCETLNEREINLKILNEYSFSKEQAALIVPDALQIKKGDYLNIDLLKLRNIILENQKDVLSYSGGKYEKGKFLFSDWQTPDDDCLKISDANKKNICIILQDYKASRNRLLNRKKYDSALRPEDIEVLLNFVTNSNLFDIQIEGDSNIPTAPLILFLMVTSNSVMTKKAMSKKWAIEELLSDNYCLREKTLENRLKIGLYIRIQCH